MKFRFDAWSSSPERNAIDLASLSALLLLACWQFDASLATQIVQAAITGLVFAGFVAAYNLLRNHDLEAKLRRSLASHSVGTSICKDPRFPQGTSIVEVSIKNTTDVAVVLRRVAFTTQHERSYVIPSQIHGYCFVDPLKPTTPAEMVLADDRENAISTFITLPPRTQILWGLPVHRNSPWKWSESHVVGSPVNHITGCEIVFEYPKLLGGNGFVTVRSQPEVGDMLRKIFDMQMQRHGILKQPNMNANNTLEPTVDRGMTSA